MAKGTPSYPSPFGHFEEALWEGDPGAYGGRRARRPFRFEAFVPVTLMERDFPLTGPTAAGVQDATLAIAGLNAEPPAISGLEALATQLLRSEALASSRIEGLDISHRRLARASFDGHAAHDTTAAAVVANVRAMRQSVVLGERATPLTRRDLCAIHATLLDAPQDAKIAGQIRTRQNWIGTSSSSPAGAEFIPPPARFVDALVDDLCAFVERTDLPELAQAAVAHAQFETIHPFTDGNGRLGRCIVQLILRRREIAPRWVPPISLVLARRRPEYIAGLTAYRAGRVDEWIETFARATYDAATAANGFAHEIASLSDEWRQRAGRPRAGSAASITIEHLPEHPVLDGKTVQRLADCSDVAALRALRTLEDAGVVHKVRNFARNRVWECRELLVALNGFEDQPVSSTG